MSLQNLLEMDDLSQPGYPADRRSAFPQPKPRPRTSNNIPTTMQSPPTAPSPRQRRKQSADEVISISPVSPRESLRPRSRNQRKELYYSPSPKHTTRFEQFNKSAFDNQAFMSDKDDSDASIKSNETYTAINSKSTKPGTFNRNNVRNQTFTKKTKPKDYSSADMNANWSENEEENERVKDDEEDAHSDATFTVENEKSHKKNLSKKPPQSPSSPSKISRIPRPRPRKLSDRADADDDNDDDKEQKKPLGKDNSSKKPKQEYLAVQVEDDYKNGNNDDDKNDENKEVAVDESETVSVSSAATSLKDSVKKSRFGKIFGSSQNKKSKNISENKDEKTKQSESEVGESESEPATGKPANKSSLMYRWKKSAHTFLKSTQKQIDEETAIPQDEKDAEIDKEKVEERNKPETAEAEEPNSSLTHVSKKKSTETRIFMPDSHSEDDEDEKDKMGKDEKTPRKSPSGKKLVEKQPPSRYKSLTRILSSKDKSLKSPKIKSDEELSDKMEKPKKKDKEERKELKKKKKSRKEREPTASPAVSASSSAVEEDEDNSSDDGSAFHEEKSPTAGPIEATSDSAAKKWKDVIKKRREKLNSLDSLQLTDSASGKELLFGLTIHSCDLLPIDPNVIHPVVKVTVMFQNGQYMKRNVNEEGGKKKSRSKHKKKRKGSSGLLNYTEHVSESILPIMSQPCKPRYSLPTFAPTWNELLIFEEPFKRFVTQNSTGNGENETENNLILFFELMDFLPMNKNGSSVSISGFHGSEEGWYKVAWGFLKLIGSNGDLNVNRKLRLQLYKPVKLRTKDKLGGPEVYSWWRNGKREKVNATLYITPKGILPPETKTTASLRQLLSMRKDQLTQAILDSQLATSKKEEKERRPSLYELREHANWTRMEGQSCKPPNKLIAALPSSQIESLNIVVSGNVHSLKFSPCGHKLAASLHTDELHVILIFEVPSWTLLKSLKGHHGIIYDLCWKIFELDDYTSFHYLASASADSTVRIWKMTNHDEKSLSLFKILYHPSFVYAVKFHPTHPSLLVTGCYDYVIRIWDIKPDHAVDLSEKKMSKAHKRGLKQNEVSPIILLDKHNSFVNALHFDPTGQHLFSGDGAAYLFKWSCLSSPSQRRSWRLERDVKLHHGDIPVNNIDLHPSGNRVLVHLRDNFIKILDVSTFIPLQSFAGLQNVKFQIRSCFSPCGNLVLSGSEKSVLCIWDADTGKILQFINPKNHPQCTVTSVDYHPFDFYIAIGLTSAISEPSPILLYFHEKQTKMNYPLLKKTAMKFRQSLEKSQSSTAPESFSEDVNPPISSRMSAKRGNSSEKFISIIQKLDSALYLAQQRNKQRERETSVSNCATNAKPPSSPAPDPPQQHPKREKKVLEQLQQEPFLEKDDDDLSDYDNSTQIFQHDPIKVVETMMELEAKMHGDEEMIYSRGKKIPSPRHMLKKSRSRKNIEMESSLAE